MRSLKKAIAKVPLLRQLARGWSLGRLGDRVPLLHTPGHFYSVLPALEDLDRDSDRIFARRPVAGIDLEAPEALALREQLPALAAAFPYSEQPTPPLRYGSRNGFFSEADAVVLYSFLRHFRPRRWIEVGCGHSTRVVLDTNRDHLQGSMQCTLIDPFANDLLRWMEEAERSTAEIIPRRVQDVSLELFEQLDRDDVLFIDSSHASKVGSDVNWLFFEVLPRLAPGVIVHLHDIPWPFEYPEHWFRRGFAWNEAYLARALLQESTAWEVLWFVDYLAQEQPDYVDLQMPRCKEEGVSLWLRRCAAEPASR